MGPDQTLENAKGIKAILIGVALISVGDSLVKVLSDTYPLHQIILFRASIGSAILLSLVWRLGGVSLLYVSRPWLHAMRAFLVILANLTFFTGLTMMPLAQATAIFFIAPLLICVLSWALLGLTMGRHQMIAVIIGLIGVLLVSVPDFLVSGLSTGWPVLLPLIAALSYALMQVLTRALGPEAHPAAMAFYIQSGFIFVCLAFWGIAGDGVYVTQDQSPALTFLLRAWVWPELQDMWFLVALGPVIAGIAWFITQAYRLADPATIAPFEYMALPLSAVFGFVFFSEVPSVSTICGMAVILFAGLYMSVSQKN